MPTSNSEGRGLSLYDEALVSVCKDKGQVRVLNELSFNPHLICQSIDAARFVAACMQLESEGVPPEQFNFTNILQRIGRLDNLSGTYYAFKNGHGSNAALAVTRAKQDFLQRKAQSALEEAKKELATGGKSADSALASIITRLESLLRNGDDSDGDAERAFREPLPKKIADLQSVFMRDLFGGVYSCVLAVIVSPLGRGKTTSAITFLNESMRVAESMSRKVLVISGEWPRGYYTARLLKAQGFQQGDIDRYNEQGDNGSEVSTSMKQWLDYIKATVKVFGHDKLELGQIQHLVRLHKPIATVIDHLSTVRNSPRRNQTDASAMDETVYGLEDLANDTSSMILSFSQMNSAQIAEFDKTGKLGNFGGKGSGGIGEAARLGAVQGRTDMIDTSGRPCGVFWNRMKCTVPGMKNDPSWRVEAMYDYEREIYVDAMVKRNIL